jgi:uncharacterized protein YprB with RNaseH-like and TPR domain
LPKPRIAFFDIETAPITGLTWTMYEANVFHVIKPTYMLCYSIKWSDRKGVKTRSLDQYPGYELDRSCDKALATELHADMSTENMLICAHNGDAFDIKKMQARFAVHDLPPIPPSKTIDTLKIARRNFKFDSNKLDNIGRYLGLGRKLPHTGKDLWVGCMNGDPKSLATMRRYNAQDCRLLEAVYHKIAPYHPTHPDLTAYSLEPGCPVCQSTNIQNRGVNVAKTRRTQRLHCQDCGHWFSGAVIK